MSVDPHPNCLPQDAAPEVYVFLAMQIAAARHRINMECLPHGGERSACLRALDAARDCLHRMATGLDFLAPAKPRQRAPEEPHIHDMAVIPDAGEAGYR